MRLKLIPILVVAARFDVNGTGLDAKKSRDQSALARRILLTPAGADSARQSSRETLVTAASHPAFCTRSPAWPSGSTGGDCKAEGAQLSACVQPSRLAGGGGDGGESVAVGFVVVVLAREEAVTGAAAAPEESAHASAQQARREHGYVCVEGGETGVGRAFFRKQPPSPNS